MGSLAQRSHLLVRASAGTGKTYTLVHHYLRLVDEGFLPSEIVVLTFTRRAARELQSRILQGLSAASVRPAVMQELGSAPIGNFHTLSLRWLKEWGALGDHAPFELLAAGDDLELFLGCADEVLFALPETAGDVASLAHHFDIDRLGQDMWRAYGSAREEGIDPSTLSPGIEDPASVRYEAHQCLLELSARLGEACGSLSKVSSAKVQAFLDAPRPSLDDPALRWRSLWEEAGKPLSRQGALGKLITPEEMQLFRGGLACVEAADVMRTEGPRLLALLQKTTDLYRAEKKNRGLVDFGDLVEMAYRELRRRPAQAKAVLVDEAQDTNRLQREWLAALARWSEPEGAHVMAVGDPKQAIYTFRGSSPDAFAQLEDTLQDSPAGSAGKTLSTSYRSGRGVVDAVNAIGGALLAGSYDSLEWHPPCGEGRVRYLEVDAERDRQPRAEIEALAADIADAVGAGVPPGDQAVLLRTMRRGLDVVEALSALGVPAYISGGGGFFHRPEVQDMLALLQWLADPEDRLAASIFLHSPMGGVDTPELNRLLVEDADALPNILRGAPPDWLEEILPALCQNLRELRRAAKLSTAREFGLLVLRHLEPGQAYAGPGAVSAGHNISRLLGSAASESLESWVARLSRRAAVGASRLAPADIDREEPDAVAVFTVHQAKGLQFPRVYLADLGARTASDGRRLAVSDGHLWALPRKDGARLETPIWRRIEDSLQSQERSELQRLLYVAITRAEGELVFVGPPLGSIKASQNSFLGLLGPALQDAPGVGWLEIGAAATMRQEAGTSAESSPPVAGDGPR